MAKKFAMVVKASAEGLKAESGKQIGEEGFAGGKVGEREGEAEPSEGEGGREGASGEDEGEWRESEEGKELREKAKSKRAEGDKAEQGMELAEALKAWLEANQLDAGADSLRIDFLWQKVRQHDLMLKTLTRGKEGDASGIPASGMDCLIPPPMSPEDVVFEQFDDMADLADERMNIMLYGPTGSGKSHIARQLAQKLRLPFYSQSCSEGMNESVFMGMKIPGDGGKWVYEPSRFVQFFANGGVYLLDEMDAADANLLVYPNTAISNGWLSLELDGGRMVKRHPNFILIGTANSAGHGGDSSYLRNELDVATLRRFKTGMIQVPYSSAVEEKLVDESVLAWGKVMRQAVDALMIDRLPVSTGLLLDYSKMKRNKNWTPKRWTASFMEGLNRDQQEMLRKEFGKIIKSKKDEAKAEAAKAGVEWEG